MNDIQTHNGPSLANFNPFEKRDQLAERANAGAVLVEQERAIAEVKGKLSVAKMFPRNEALAFQKVMDSCSRRSLAEVAFYSFPRGNKTVSGETIDLAKEMARCWGNIDYGMRELSRGNGYSEMMAYAWDLETNTISEQRFTVAHIRDKSDGGAKVTSERDIYELTANQASRRMRERVFAVLPPDLIRQAAQRCRDTLAGNTDTPIADRVRTVIAAFNKFGVNAQMLEARLGRPLDQMLPDDFVEYTGIRNSLRDGNSTATDWFGGETPALTAPTTQPTAGNDNQQPAEADKGSKRGTKQKSAPKGDAHTVAAAIDPAASNAAYDGMTDADQHASAPALATPAAAQQQAAPAAQQPATGGLGDVF